MQDILTIAVNATTITAVSFFLMQFFAGIMSKRNRIAPGQLSLFSDDAMLSQCYAEALQDDGDWLTEIQQVETVAVAPAQMIDRIVPFVRPVKKQAIDWAEMKPADLRKACQKAGIRWRNAHGKNKHLTKAEMIAELTLAASA